MALREQPCLRLHAYLLHFNHTVLNNRSVNLPCHCNADAAEQCLTDSQGLVEIITIVKILPFHVLDCTVIWIIITQVEWICIHRLNGYAYTG